MTTGKRALYIPTRETLCVVVGIGDSWNGRYDGDRYEMYAPDGSFLTLPKIILLNAIERRMVLRLVAQGT